MSRVSSISSEKIDLFVRSLPRKIHHFTETDMNSLSEVIMKLPLHQRHITTLHSLHNPVVDLAIEKKRAKLNNDVVEVLMFAARHTSVSDMDELTKWSGGASHEPVYETMYRLASHADAARRANATQAQKLLR